MLLWSVLGVVALLVAGWYGRDALQLARSRTSRLRVHYHRRRMLRGRGVALDWVIRYYHVNQPDSALFRLPNGRLLPYLTKPAWRPPLIRDHEISFSYRDEHSGAGVEHRWIRLRRRRGERIWDGAVYCLRLGVVEDGAELRIDVCRGRYFQYLSLVDKLTQEAVACARSRRRRPVLRDTIARSVLDLQSGRPQAQLVGFAVALLLAGDNGWRVLIQQRSFETGVAPNLHAVVPAFVIEPVDTNGTRAPSPFHDFLREVSEELYASRHHADTGTLRGDWYLENEDVLRLRALHDQGKLQFEIVGFGFDALTTEMNFAAVAVLNDPDIVQSELRRMQVNWEVAGIRTMLLDSPEVEALINSPTIYHTSAFALWCAREWSATNGTPG